MKLGVGLSERPFWRTAVSDERGDSMPDDVARAAGPGNFTKFDERRRNHRARGLSQDGGNVLWCVAAVLTRSVTWMMMFFARFSVARTMAMRASLRDPMIVRVRARMLVTSCVAALRPPSLANLRLLRKFDDVNNDVKRRQAEMRGSQRQQAYCCASSRSYTHRAHATP
jgi:hypothetical protein